MSRPSTSSVLRMAAWFGLAFLVFYLLFIGGGWSGIYVVQLRIASLVLVVGVLVAWGVIAAVRPAWRPRSAIWPALAVPLAVMGVTAALSRSPRISAEYLAWAVLLVALYLLLQRLLASDFFRPRVMGLAVLLCAVVGILYVLVCLSAWVGWWGLVGHLAVPPLRPGFAGLTWGNPSAVMTIAVLLLASAIGHLGFATNGRRLAVLLLTVLTLVVTLLSGSRAGWLALAAGLLVTVVAWLIVPANRAAVRGLAPSRRARVAIVGTAALGTMVAVVLTPAVILRATAGGETVRVSYYAAAWTMGLDSPAVGSGPGMWVAQRIAYTPAPETDYYIPHAHDLYLQTFAEHGVLGLVAGAIAVGCLLWLLARAVRSEDPLRRRLGWCAVFATAYFGAHQVLDFYPNMPAALFAFALPVAWLDARSDRSIASGRLPAGWRRTAGVGLAGLVAVAVGVLAWSETSALDLDGAVRAANRADWPAAVPAAEAAVRRDPEMPANQLVLGLAAARVGDLTAAEKALATAAAADDLPVAWLDLAAVQVALGEDAAARESLRRAMRLGEQQATVALGAGDLYLRIGEPTSAHDAFVAAIRTAPSLAGDPYWTAREEVAAMWPSVLDGALALMPPQSGF
ncbi:MAG: O-antigen ligase family protein, partial [Chloroflexi bacterium]|nr:O-antigen ligase family protein [Chloroflexota bacterium]